MIVIEALRVVKRMILISLVSWSILFQSAYAINPNEIRWDYHIGQDPHQPDIEYSLVSAGFFRAELSADFGTILSTWLKNHADARLIPVITRGPMNDRAPNSKLIFVWIVDHDDNLNVYLVRHGCVAAAQMFSFSDDEFRSLREQFRLPKDKLQVSRIEYYRVKKRLLAAEKLAKAERLGIWANPESEADHTRD